MRVIGKTLILGIDELAQGQSQAFTTANDAFAALEEAANMVKDIDATANGTIAIAEIDLVRYQVFEVADHTADITLTYTPTINTNTTNRVVTFVNKEAFQITLQSVSTPVATVVIPGNSSRIVYIRGTSCFVVAEGQKLTGSPFTIGIFSGGVPTNNSEILRYPMVESVRFADNFAGSLGSIGVNPTKAIYASVLRNGVAIGRIDVSTGGAFTFSTTAAIDEDFDVGDVLSLIYYAPQYGSIAFTSVADAGDTVTLNDGTNAPTVFTFVASGGSGTNVNVGTTALDSATNLHAAINAVGAGLLVTSIQSTTTLTLRNDNTLGGGSIAKSDGDNDYAITAFAVDTTGANIGINLKGIRF